MKNKNENKNNNQTNPTTNNHGKGGRVPTHQHRLVLPLMKSAADAHALARQEDDKFYLVAFVIGAWLGHSVLHPAAEYAEKKDPRTRSLQTGQSWRSFALMFAPSYNITKPADTLQPQDFTTKALGDLLHCIFRYAQFESPMRETLCEALASFCVEAGLDYNDCIANPPLPSSVKDPASSIARLCEWLDAVLHMHTHTMWFVAPHMFDPDPETRDLVAMGTIQRNWAKIDPTLQAHWRSRFEELSRAFADSPKLAAIGAGISSDQERHWTYEDIDKCVITVWPLLKRHNWTYADLLKTIRPNIKHPAAYPCETERTFATYCTNVLGLRKTGKGTSSEGELIGADVARRLLGVKK